MSVRIACDRVAMVYDRKVSDHLNPKLLSTKQMFQRLSITLPQVKVGNASKNLLNEIRQVIYSLR